MVTPLALNADIHSHTNNFPTILATWMGFLHFHNIIQVIFLLLHSPNSSPY
ncbi:hypothetical protein BMB171_C5076 [Bacillus thuringiensis BMB171]|nr:hypothetical protein BMB171_C5076 [Bacillus thuringiensis BMB171]